MAILNIFSKRQKQLRGEFPDVYQYDKLPESLRIQIIHIITATIGQNEHGGQHKIYAEIHKILCKEYGVFGLVKNSDTDFDAILEYFMTTTEVNHCLDVIELCFRAISGIVSVNYQYYSEYCGSTQEPEDAISELNGRFKEAGIGYQFESDEIIRVDSEIMHSEVVKPVLALLGRDSKFSGTNEEFLSAHEHYRHGRHKDCLVHCLKAFESLMKAICDKRKWKYEKGDTAQKLINICLVNNLIPEYLQSHFTSLRSLLESGVPTLRNKEGGHGQGAEIKHLPEHYASYGLHLTASNLLFLINCDAKYKK